MFNRVSIVFLFFLTINSTICLKSTDLCTLKQKECKGFYDEQENYHIECHLVKCYGSFNYECDTYICSRNKTECDEYKRLNVHINNLTNEKQANSDPKIAANNLKEIAKFKMFNRVIQECPIKIYEFNSNDFCLNEINCIEKNLNLNKEIDCKCPTNHSFVCTKYCTTDSNACDYFKSVSKNENSFANINDCNNFNITATRPYKYNFDKKAFFIFILFVLLASFMIINLF